MAKKKPPMSASQSGRLDGKGHADSGVFRITTTPASANTRRANEPKVGRSPSKGQASNTAQAGIR